MEHSLKRTDNETTRLNVHDNETIRLNVQIMKLFA